MITTTKQIIVTALIGSALAGCSDKVNNNGNNQMMVQRQEDAFGNGFGTAFRADGNADPVDPKDSDIVPVDLASEPVALK
jgi:hypothetical protein